MKTAATLFIFLFVVTTGAFAAPIRDNARDFIAAMAAYKAQDYPAAIEMLENIAKNGVINGQLYYNLGNAYLKNNDLGRALLWYERALVLLPNDPDLRFNADFARSLTRDASEETATPLVRIFFFWKYQLSPNTIIVLSILFNGLFWCLAAGWRFSRRRGLGLAAKIVLVPALVFILTATFNYYEAAHGSQAIVLPEEVSVRSGLENTSTELFVLHAGVKVKIVKRLNSHCQIRFSAQKIGWLPQAAIGRI